MKDSDLITRTRARIARKGDDAAYFKERLDRYLEAVKKGETDETWKQTAKDRAKNLEKDLAR